MNGKCCIPPVFVALEFWALRVRDTYGGWISACLSLEAANTGRGPETRPEEILVHVITGVQPTLSPPSRASKSRQRASET